MASVSDIAPLSSTSNTGGNDVKVEITKLANTIIKSSTEGLKGATQAVVGNVPQMIADLTNEIKTGSIDNFAIAMNKLVKLVDKLGINLRQYNEDLAETVDDYRGSQEQMQTELQKLREQGINAEIDQKGTAIRLLTKKEVEQKKILHATNLKDIKKLELKKEKLTQKLDQKVWAESQSRSKIQDDIIANEEKISKLREDNTEIDKQTDPKADTGSGRFEDQGFGKMAELKEAFMVVPDTIAEVFGGFKNVGKIISTSLVGFFKHPMKAISRVFGAIANIFKIARVMIALKVLAVIAAFQWVAERIGDIAGVFGKIWDAITGFFKKIGDWFKNSWLGKKLGLGGDDEGEEEKSGGVLSSEGTGKFSQMDDGTYEVGNEIPEEDDKPGIIANVKERFKKSWKFWTGDKEEEKQDIEPVVKQEFATKDDEPVKSIMKSRSVIGQTTEDTTTPNKLKELEAEQMELLTGHTIQVNNAHNITSQNSSGTTVSGFVDHEPDTSFKYIRNNNSDSNWI